VDLSGLYTVAGKVTPTQEDVSLSSAKAIERVHKDRGHPAWVSLACACEGLSITQEDAWEALEDDRMALIIGQIDSRLLRAFCESLECSLKRKAGCCPPHFTQVSECMRCGFVWMWEGAPVTVHSCPWCQNRKKGLPIPVPSIVS